MLYVCMKATRWPRKICAISVERLVNPSRIWYPDNGLLRQNRWSDISLAVTLTPAEAQHYVTEESAWSCSYKVRIECSPLHGIY